MPGKGSLRVNFFSVTLWYMPIRTQFEKIYARSIAADIKVFVEQPTGLEAQLGEVVSTIVAHEH